MQLVAPQPFEEAIQKFGERTPIGALLNSAQWRDEVPVALRERAFFSANVENIRFLQRAQSAIADFLTSARDPANNSLRTGSRAQFVSIMQNFALREGMGPLDPNDRGGLKDIGSETRLGLIFDTNVRAAQDFGNWKQGMDPAVLDEFPAQRFIRVRRVRKPRPYHQAALGQVRLKTDTDFWVNLNRDFGVPWGPWGYNSGCDVEDVDRAETERLKLLRKGQAALPVDRKFNDGLQASLRGLEAAMIDKLKSVFGPQVRVTGDTIHWAGQLPPAAPKPPRVRTPKAEPPAAPSPEPPAAPEMPAVSDALTISISNRAARKEVERVLAIIDRVHRDGELDAMPVDGRVSSGSLGTYFSLEKRLAVKTKGDWIGLTFAHEVGHALDHQALEPARPGFSTRGGMPAGSVLADWKAAVESSDAIKTLRDRLAGTGYRSGKYLRYLLDPVEIWARAYAQYIAEKSGDAVLLQNVRISSAGYPGKQWTEADFAPIRAAMDALFQKLGWIKTQ